MFFAKRVNKFQDMTPVGSRRGPNAVCAVMMAAVLIFAAPALARDALFLGITDASGQPAQPELSRAVRNSLAAAGGRVRLISELETNRIMSERERTGVGRMENAVPSSFGLPDSTILIRGEVTEFSMKIRRHWLLWGKIESRMTVKFSFSDLTGNDAYHGEFSASATRAKDLLLFRSAPKVVHISAVDRSEMADVMQAAILEEVKEFVESYINSLEEKDREVDEVGEEVEEIEEVETPETADTTAIQMNPEDVDFSDVMGDNDN